MFGGAVRPDGFGGLGVEGAGPLGFPVQSTAGIAHLVVDLPGAPHAFGDVGGVGGDLAGDDALFYVLQIGQGQMLGGGHIAEEGRAVHGRDGPADGRRDVVVPRSNVGDEGTQHIEGSAHADGLLDLHVGGDLVHRHMAGAFHHDLHVLLPGALGQLTQPDQLLDLADIGGIGQAAGTAGVAQRDGHVVFPADVENLVIVLVEGILLTGHAHPGKDQRPAPGDDVHLPLVLADLVDGLAGDAAVQRHKIDAILRVQAHHVDKIFCGERVEVALVVDDAVIHRHSADHGRALGGELAAEGLCVAVA